MAGLSEYRKPFLTIFGALDPILGSEAVQNGLIDLVSGANAPDHDRYEAGRFIHEDAGRDLAEAIHFFMLAHLIGRQVCRVPVEPASELNCAEVCDHVVTCHPDQRSAAACSRRTARLPSISGERCRIHSGST